MAPPRILVVEDDEQARLYLAVLLRGWGYHVDMAASGLEALQRVEENCPSVVISDLVMPGMNGIDLLKALKANDKCVIFFILITGKGSVTAGVSAIVEGAHECLLKPVDPDALRAILERHRIVPT